MNKRGLVWVLCCCCHLGIFSQGLEFEGQFSTIGSYSPDNELDLFLGGRYIPTLSYGVDFDSTKTIDFEASMNISGTLLFESFQQGISDGQLSPYRIWARYSTRQFELRLGLQKIDFGSASLIRPIQWFNQIDPRDPLQLTNGVYGLLGRYYFLNNANVWFWVLYGNEKTRGFDAIETNNQVPEIGGRVQYPIPNGEIALSYHHRIAQTTNFPFAPSFSNIPENRVGLDGKWDLGVGLWFEAAHIHKSKNIGLFTNQTLLNIGTDYTFGLGNGLNVVAEHFLISLDEKVFEFKETANISALIATYPLGFFDNLSSIFYYAWTTNDLTLLLNYQHQFPKITTYLMLYYNPNTQQGIQQNDLVNQFAGPGIRLMMVYNH